MYTILLIVALLLGAIGYSLKGRYPRFGQVCLLGSVAGCMALTLWQISQSFGSGVTQRTHRGQASVAYTLAHRFLSDTNARKGDIIILFPPDKIAPVAALDSFYEAFARVMLRFPNISLKEVTLEMNAKELADGTFDLNPFEAVLSSNPNVLAYVSWVGFPRGGEDLIFFQTGQQPPLYMYAPSSADHWKSGLEKGIINAVARQRDASDRATPSSDPKTPTEIFNVDHVLVTP